MVAGPHHMGICAVEGGPSGCPLPLPRCRVLRPLVSPKRAAGHCCATSRAFVSSTSRWLSRVPCPYEAIAVTYGLNVCTSQNRANMSSCIADFSPQCMYMPSQVNDLHSCFPEVAAALGSLMQLEVRRRLRVRSRIFGLGMELGLTSGLVTILTLHCVAVHPSSLFIDLLFVLTLTVILRSWTSHTPT